MEITLQDNEKKNKTKGAIASVVVHALLLLLFLYFGFSSEFPPAIEGILINFGTTETGLGDTPSEIIEEPEKLSPTEIAVPIPVQETQVEETEVATQDIEEVPAIKKTEIKKEPKKEPEKKKEVKPQPVKEPVKEVKEPVKEEPKVDSKSLYTGQQTGKNNPSHEGITYGPGDQGDPKGDPSSKNYYGETTGLGNSGIGYDLAGRKMLNIPVITDESQETGKVAVRIKVDRNGNILEAIYTTKGSTTTNSYLISLAEKAARDAKFNNNSNAPEEQWGTIVFTFKLR